MLNSLNGASQLAAPTPLPDFTLVGCVRELARLADTLDQHVNRARFATDKIGVSFYGLVPARASVFDGIEKDLQDGGNYLAGLNVALRALQEQADRLQGTVTCLDNQVDHGPTIPAANPR